MKSPCLVLAALAAAGCAGTLQYPGNAEYVLAKGYDARRPADVAVLPVAGDLPADAAEALREALRRKLLEMRYATVRLREVDAAPDKFRPGGENAVLEISVKQWDDAALYGNGGVRFTAEARLFGPGSLEVLYRGTVTDRPVRASDVATSMEDRPTTLAQAAAEAAGEVLGGLPVKGDG